MSKKRYVFVGTGGRAVSFLEPMVTTYRDHNELLALCDVSATRMAYYNERLAGWGHPAVPAWPAERFDEMVRTLKPDLPGPALCLVGPPGTGKSSLGAAVAHALRRPSVRISVSGTTNANELRGESRRIPGAQPGKIVRALRDAGVGNPVLIIDGIDRLIGEAGLEVIEVLVELLLERRKGPRKHPAGPAPRGG